MSAWPFPCRGMTRLTRLLELILILIQSSLLARSASLGQCCYILRVALHQDHLAKLQLLRRAAPPFWTDHRSLLAGRAILEQRNSGQQSSHWSDSTTAKCQSRWSLQAPSCTKNCQTLVSLSFYLVHRRTLRENIGTAAGRCLRQSSFLRLYSFCSSRSATLASLVPPFSLLPHVQNSQIHRHPNADQRVEIRSY